MVDLRGKNVTVVGIGRSGVALVRVLLEEGARVFVSDAKTSEELQPQLREIVECSVELELGGHTEAIYRGKDMVIISPGVPVNHPMLKAAREEGVPVIGEVELAYQLCPAPIIAVTGTNGKSTTVALIHQALLADGRRAVLAGNIGCPLVGEVRKISKDTLVVAEVSSFQLESIKDFRPEIAVFLNISVDHLDRHAGLDEYLELKERLFSNQTGRDYAVLNADDPKVAAFSKKVKSQVYLFSKKSDLPRGSFFKNGEFFFSDGGRMKRFLSASVLRLSGGHNLENLLAMVAVAGLLGVKEQSVQVAVREFKALPHRLQEVCTAGGVRFVDDSKGTNPGAVIAALESFEKDRVILIAGGKNKEINFAALGKIIARRAKGLVLLGEASPKIEEAARIAGMENIRHAACMRSAVRTAYEMSGSGDVVLLSPSCASFDMFRCAEERGEIFQRYAMELKEELS